MIRKADESARWLHKIGFSPCIKQWNTSCKPDRFEPSTGLLLLYYDIKRLNKLEDEYVARTGIKPPLLSQTKEGK